MKKEKWFWGMFFILAAVLLVISKIGILNVGISIGMMFFSIIFAATLIKSAVHRNIPGVLFSLAFLCIIYAKPLGITELTPWTVLGAALLGSIGASILYHPKHAWYHSSHFDDTYSDVESIEGEQMVLETNFGSSIKYINSEDFKSANVKCSFGAMKVYLDHAMVPDGKAVLNLDVSFSGVDLYVPKNWKIVNQVSSAFGGLDEKGRYDQNQEITLVLTGKISFAGVTVIYV